MGRNTFACVLLFWLTALCVTPLVAASPDKTLSDSPAYILFINPADPANSFWDQVEEQMRYAATDFGFQLQILYANGSPLRVRSLATQALTSQEKPDFLLLQFDGPIMPELLMLALQQQVKVVTFNTQQSAASRKEIARPRARYPNWLAHLWPNDRLAGKLVAQALLQAGQERWPRERPTMLAFNGAKSEVSHVARERSHGLHQLMSSTQAGRLAQEFSGYWDAEKATRPLFYALKRYPDTRLLWSASDAMGLRLRQQLIEGGRDPKEFLIASIDATPQGVAAVERGELVATIGGHFMEGVWCLVLIYDYLNQHDFADEAVEFNTDIQVFDRHGVRTLHQLYTTQTFARLDYRAFTRSSYNATKGKANKAWSGYDFSWRHLLEIMQEQGLLQAPDKK